MRSRISELDAADIAISEHSRDEPSVRSCLCGGFGLYRSFESPDEVGRLTEVSLIAADLFQHGVWEGYGSEIADRGTYRR
jgi:hypothetical protein